MFFEHHDMEEINCKQVRGLTSNIFYSKNWPLSLKPETWMTYLGHPKAPPDKTWAPLIQSQPTVIYLITPYQPITRWRYMWFPVFQRKARNGACMWIRLGGSYRDNLLWLILAACFHVYQHNGDVYWVVVEDVTQLPGLGEETSVEETTKDLVKGFTILQKNDSIHMYIKHNITYVL